MDDSGYLTDNAVSNEEDDSLSLSSNATYNESDLESDFEFEPAPSTNNGHCAVSLNDICRKKDIGCDK